MNSDSALTNAKLTCGQDGRDTSSAIISNSCKVKQSQLMQKDFSGQDDHHGGHATDEEKLASSVGVKPDKDQSNQDCHVTSKAVEADCCSVQYEDPCKLKNKS